MKVIPESEPVLLTLDTDQPCPLYWMYLHRQNITRVVHYACTRENGIGLSIEYRDRMVLKKETDGRQVLEHALGAGHRLTKDHMFDLCTWLAPLHTNDHMTANQLFELLLVFVFDSDEARTNARLAADRPMQTIDSRFDAAVQDPLMEEVCAHFDDDEHNKKDFNPMRAAVRRKSVRQTSSIIDEALRSGLAARTNNALAKAAERASNK